MIYQAQGLHRHQGKLVGNIRSARKQARLISLLETEATIFKGEDKDHLKAIEKWRFGKKA